MIPKANTKALEKVQQIKQNNIDFEWCLKFKICPKCSEKLHSYIDYSGFFGIHVYACKNIKCKFLYQDIESEDGPISWEEAIR